jgi:hypothetical protein
VNAALWYLFAETTRNQWKARIARLRNPRYAIAFLLGLAYFWFLYVRPQQSAHASDAGAGLGRALSTAGPLMIVLYAAWTWLFGGDRTALAFTQAEVSLLFSAPLTRRSLIVYKLLKGQLPMLLMALFWVLILRRGMGTLPAALRLVGVYAMMNTINLHRIGAALVMATATEHGRSGAKRSVVALAVFAFVFGSIGWAAWTARGAFDIGAGEGMRAVAAALQVPPASVAMYPFVAAFAPMFATTTAEWLRAIGPALALVALHVWWVLRSDAAFEESAVEASVLLAKRLEAMRSRQGATQVVSAKGAKRSLPLAPVGAPAVAIVWKNTLWLMRSGTMRGLFLPAGLAIVIYVIFRGKPDVLGPMMIALGGMVSVMLTFFGPITLRNDLRSDLLHLPLLKTLPLRGRDVVLAQVASGAIPVAAAQYLTMLVALAALQGTPIAAKWNADAMIGGAVGVPLLLLGLDATTFLIHNAIALLFPAWVKLGEHGAGGVEAMGQMMMTMAAVLLCLAVALVLPAVAGAALFFGLRAQMLVAVALAGAGAGAVLCAQCYGLTTLLGRTFERVEPQQVG